MESKMYLESPEEKLESQKEEITQAHQSFIFDGFENVPKDLGCILADLEETKPEERADYVNDFISADWSSFNLDVIYWIE